MPQDKLRLALCISGGGTTMREIIRACKSGRLSRIQPACVIASNNAAGGIEKAKTEGISPSDILVIDPKTFTDPSAFADALLRACKERSVDLIGQYGWLPKTPAGVVQAYEGRMINQHPGPLDPGHPDFGGKGMFGRRVHCARLYFLRIAKRPQKDWWTEATAQRVALQYDHGAVLRTRQVLIEPKDDTVSLQERVLPQEHAVQIETLEDFSEGRVREMIREVPLVTDGELALLDEAKRIARMVWPTG